METKVENYLISSFRFISIPIITFFSYPSNAGIAFKRQNLSFPGGSLHVL